MIALADLVSEERVVLDFEAGDSRVVLDELGRLLGGADGENQEGNEHQGIQVNTCPLSLPYRLGIRHRNDTGTFTFSCRD